MIFLPLVIFIVGLLIGSFLNVVILRMNTGRSIATGRSKCARCSRVLAWYELIPVLSFLGLRGKCRSCKLPISFQYPLVELTSALAFIVLFSRIVLPHFFSGSAWITFLGALIAAALLLIIVVYDARHSIIPDTMVYPLILLGLISILWRWILVPSYLPGQAVVEGLLVAAPFFLLWFLSKGRLMGFGDVKLALALGWLLGTTLALAGFLVAFWIGGICGVFLLAVSRTHKLRSEIPFAPFLILGVAVVYFFNLSLTSFFPFL